jgi:predicted nucleic acid-binding protein
LLPAAVKGPAEGVLDSRFLLNAAEIGNQMARNLKIEGGFEIEDYLARCATLLGGTIRAKNARTAMQVDEDEIDDEDDEIERWDWVGLGRRAAKRTKRVPTIDFMLGPLAVEHKRRNVGKRGPIDKVGPIVRPKQVSKCALPER